MKILFVVDAFRGGAGNVIQIISREFRDRGYDCTIFLTNGKIVEPKYELNGIKIIDHKLDNYVKTKNPVLKIIRYIEEFKKIFDKVKPDAIISFLTNNNTLSCIANKSKVPLIISERIDPAKAKVKFHWDLLRKIFYGKADVITVQCSNFSSFCNGKFKNKIAVVPNPILKPDLSDNSIDEKEKITFISMGRLSNQKNFPWMFHVMKKIHSICENTELKIYGDGDEKDNLLKLIKKLNAEDYIEIVGYTDSPYEVLKNADIYLMTSDYEGFPNALSEAMAIGLPCISRLCHEGIADLVTNKENGFLTDLNDEDGFVEYAVQLVKSSDLRKKISFEAEKVSETYSVEKIVDIWEGLIKKLL